MKFSIVGLAVLLSTGLVSASPAGKSTPTKSTSTYKTVTSTQTYTQTQTTTYTQTQTQTTTAQQTQTQINQVNQCGNNNNPYCCNTDAYGAYTQCYAMTFSSQCGATTVCCNAAYSNQQCMGNAIIVQSPSASSASATSTKYP